MSTSNLSPSTLSANDTTIFKNDQHATNISRKLLKFYEEEQFFDIDLIAGSDRTKIQAHKIVLLASSEYFVELFRSHPATSKTIEIKEIEGSSLELIVDYMYSGSIELSLEKIEPLLRSAVFLKMKNLIDGCRGFLEKNLNTGNCLRFLHLTKELSLTELREQFLNFLYINFEEATKQAEFLLLNEIELKDLLFNNNTNEDLEEQVFLSLMAWIEYDKVNRHNLLLDLLSMVRYHFLTAEFIIENRQSIVNRSLIQYQHSSESRTNEEQKFTSTITSVRRNDNLNQDGDTATKAVKEGDKIGVINLNSQMEMEIRSYNQELRTWSIEKRVRAYLKIKDSYSMILIDEKLFVVGGAFGYESPLKSVNYIDLKTFQWADLPPMRVGRCNSQLANLNGHLCVFGGFEQRSQTGFIDSVEIFNPSTQKWNDLQPLNKPGKKNIITGYNGILYIFDFYYGCLQCFDVSTGKWTLKDQPVDDDIKDFSITGIDNLLYAISLGYETGNFVKSFDLTKNSWSEVAELTSITNVIGMVTVIGKKILFLGEHGVIVEYNIDTKEFTNYSALVQISNYCIFPFKL